MTASDGIIFLLDMDNTLLDHDQIGMGFDHHLAKEFGEKSWNRYWKIVEGLRHGHYAFESLNLPAP